MDSCDWRFLGNRRRETISKCEMGHKKPTGELLWWEDANQPPFHTSYFGPLPPVSSQIISTAFGQCSKPEAGFRVVEII